MFQKTFLAGALLITCSVPQTTLADSSAMIQVKRDLEITHSINSAYKEAPLLMKQSIAVKTIDNQVFLTGEVDSQEQYEEAIFLAASTLDVMTVNIDHLSVKSSDAPLTDLYISAKVKAAFLKEKLFGSKKVAYWPISVKTTNGIVHLSGQLHSNTERMNLIKLAQSVMGVTQVKSTITIVPS